MTELHFRPPLSALPVAHHHIVTEANRFLGITKPVSLQHPDPRELELSAKLIETLKNHNLFESEEDGKKR
jgi:poly(A) polymerase Pap1